LVTREGRERFSDIMLRTLKDESFDLSALIAMQRAGRPLYQPHPGESIPTRIDMDTRSSETRTIIEVETEDRIGLLYSISQVFTELQIDISVAKILTEKGAVVTFKSRASGIGSPSSPSISIDS